jgi:transposase
MQHNQSRYIGIDLGHKTFKAHVLDADGKEVAAFEGSLTTGRIKKQLLAKLQASDQICIESGTLSFWFKQLLENTVHCQVYILNSNSVRLIYDSLKKTDKEDAAKLAWLLYSFPKENLPLVHTPTENQERLRKLSTERRRLVHYLGAEKSRFYNLCIQSGYTSITKKDLRNSGKSIRHGHLVQKCNKHLRALLIQAAWALVRSRNGGPLQAYFQRASLTLGRKRAIVATARKMVETLFAMSKSGEFYRLAA